MNKTCDFVKESKKAKKMSVAELEFVVVDCGAAATAMVGVNPEMESYYRDCLSVYSKELKNR
jgi:hypothetical protein